MTDTVQDPQSLEDSFFDAVEGAANQEITDPSAANAAGDDQSQDSLAHTEHAQEPDVAAPAATDSNAASQGLTPEQLEHQIKSEKGRTAALKRKNAEALAQLDLLKKQNAALLAQQVPDLQSLGDDVDLAPNIAAYVSAQHASQKQLHQTHLDINQQQLTLAEQRASAIAHEYVNESVPGWQQDVQTPEFVEWISSQSPGIQALRSSNIPDDAVSLISLFRSTVNPQANRVADTAQQRQSRLLNAVSPKSAAKPVRKTTSEAFNSVEDAFFAQV
ncbi:hypothetical protein [Deefgea sp. CFH1-16]|uniref:hypothetical protein n=1 Tax=Deefgea sp. CFH1-16 TaxID=2675457 RepID=UPI0015F37E02|nr:hypothetical protein [Deefgea sp. CFH1-16]MBM5575827.1 hypothetical protein [Deefgea sp. CFH1-16]